MQWWEPHQAQRFNPPPRHARKNALRTEASTQREARDQARAAAKGAKGPAEAQRAAENEVQRIREQAVEAIQALEVERRSVLSPGNPRVSQSDFFCLVSLVSCSPKQWRRGAMIGSFSRLMRNLRLNPLILIGTSASENSLYVRIHFSNRL